MFTSVIRPGGRARPACLGISGAILLGAAAAAPAAAEAGGADPGATTEIQWVSPVRGKVTEPFDANTHRYAKVAADCGTPVSAASAGTVTSATENGGVAGVSAAIDHGAGISTTYGSLAWSSLLVHTGDDVEAGQQIAVTGLTGATLTCGLRFAVSDLGAHPTAQDPVTFLAERGVTLGG